MLRLSLPDDCSKEKPLLVCVSGGADSVCLLLSLVEKGFTCIAAHCNFHLRGNESDGDEHFVSELTDRLHIPLVQTHFDTSAYAAANHLSIEMAARELRYRWFEEERSRQGCSYIAVAHNLNDSVETIFLNLTRGTGIKGLTGISPVNGFIIRPLINVTRAQIEDFLASRNQPYRTDSTNSDTHFRRNRIRHNILPEFIAMNPSFLDTMRDTMQNLSAAQATIDNPSSPESRLHELYTMLNPYGFSHDRIHQIWQAEQDNASGKLFQVNEVTVVVDRGKARLHLPSTLPRLSISIEEVPRPVSLKAGPDHAYFDADRLICPLSLRYWQAGDWFIPFGMKGRKKVSDFLTELKLDVVEKNHQPLLVDAAGNVIWIVGKRTDNRFCVDNKSVRVAKVTVNEFC